MSEGVGPERRQRPSSDLRRSPAPAKDRPSRATRLLASESTPRGDILALQPVHRSRWTACRRGSAAPPTMVLEENVRVSGISLPAQRGGLWHACSAMPSHGRRRQEHPVTQSLRHCAWCFPVSGAAVQQAGGHGGRTQSEYSESSPSASGFARHCTPPRRPGPQPATPGPAARCLELATNGE